MLSPQPRRLAACAMLCRFAACSMMFHGPDILAEVAASAQAWQHGLVSDNSTEWARRFGQLQQYVQA